MALQRITPQSADRICVLLVGQAGTGKTSQIRCLLGQDYQDGQWVDTTMPPEKVLVLSAESGLLCVRDLVAAGKVDGFEVRSLADFMEALRYCRSEQFAADGYRWIFIDSLTEIASRCVEEMQRRYPSKGDSFKLWGDYSQSMTQIIKDFRDMPAVNVVFTCLVTIDKDEVGRRFQSPDMPGSALKSKLTSYFDEVLVMDDVQTEDGTQERVFRTRAATREQRGLPKDRSGLLEELEYPNLLMVRDKIVKLNPESATARRS